MVADRFAGELWTDPKCHFGLWQMRVGSPKFGVLCSPFDFLHSAEPNVLKISYMLKHFSGVSPQTSITEVKQFVPRPPPPVPSRRAHIGVGAQSTVGQDIFAGKLCMKNYQNARIFMTFARKINNIPE